MPQELRAQLDTGLLRGTDIDLEPDLVVVDPEVDDAVSSPRLANIKWHSDRPGVERRRFGGHALVIA
jgi:hypothetical protein